MLPLAVEGALLAWFVPSEVYDGFCASRLEGWSGAFGTLPAGIDAGAIVERAAPRID